jgi:hypothetical protein
LAVEAVNVDDKDWVFACVADIIHNEVRMWWVWNLSPVKEAFWNLNINFVRRKLSLEYRQGLVYFSMSEENDRSYIVNMCL